MKKMYSDALAERDFLNEIVEKSSVREKTIENINPDFVAYLVYKGLTESEVNLCCLYAIGMKGKDMKDYTATASVYKDSSIIRQKLGLMENDTNLSNYLQDMLKMPSGKLL